MTTSILGRQGWFRPRAGRSPLLPKARGVWGRHSPFLVFAKAGSSFHFLFLFVFLSFFLLFLVILFLFSFFPIFIFILILIVFFTVILTLLSAPNNDNNNNEENNICDKLIGLRVQCWVEWGMGSMVAGGGRAGAGSEWSEGRVFGWKCLVVVVAMLQA